MAEFLVTSLSDDAVAGELTLRQAIDMANITTGADIIRFEQDLLGGVLTLTQGDLEISDDVLIDGDIGDDGTADITIDGDGLSRILTLTSGAANIEGLRITNGYEAAEGGGGIQVGYGASLTALNTTIAGNTSYVAGGGIQSLGDVTLLNTTISGNEGGDSGGGLDVSSGNATLVNVTIANNNAYYGGGVYVLDGTLTAQHATITSNTAYYGGGVFNGGYDTTLTNSIVLGNYAGVDTEVGFGGGYYNPLEVTFTELNIVGEDDAAFDASLFANVVNESAQDVFDQIIDNNGVDAGQLQMNGGAVETVALLNNLGNIALNAALAIADLQDVDGDGDIAEDLPVDARGEMRAPGNADLGAFEVQSPALTLSLDAASISENGATTGVVARNIVDDNDLVVTLSSSDVTGATTPASVTILAGEASASFSVSAVDDVLEDGPQNVTLTASSSGFTDGSAALEVLDDDVLLAQGDILLTDSRERLILSDTGQNRVIAGDGVDVVLTNGGDDTIDGGLGSDTLDGGAGADVLIGGAGDDFLTGGEGADVFVVDASDFNDSIGDFITDFEVGVDSLELSGFTNITDVSQLSFTSASNNLVMDLGDNRLVVFEGLTDQSEFQANDISLVGAARSLSFGQTPTSLQLSSANDRYVNTEDSAGLTVGTGAGAVNVVITGSGDDNLFGDQGDDTFIAGAGGDTLRGGLGSDVLTGGEGADLFRFSATDFSGQAVDQITDFTIGEDMIELTGFGFASLDDLTFISSPIGEAIELNTGQVILLTGIDTNDLTDSDFAFG
ncbi:MAG: M10 family metallopeptidase C-terminal domain-containing protein [Rhodobacteraceae bacterium]|nr:M10 family metallopeptidase C-terminal domain-containing protein [Paracoccaceae bacterium]